MKEFPDDNFEFDENGRKLSKQVENTVGKGENARYEQFILFPRCFQTTCPADTRKPGLVWGRVNINPFPNKPWFLPVCSRSTSLLKTLWKNEKLLVTSNFSVSFPRCFQPVGRTFCHFPFVKFKTVVCKFFHYLFNNFWKRSWSMAVFPTLISLCHLK